jgi:hypothetical protein
MTKEKRKEVLSQLMALSETRKYSETVVEDAEKESHCQVSVSILLNP